MSEAREPSEEADLERLAARLAMLAGGDGEAASAGRAVSAMSRRLGLSGGDLKQYFLAGVAAAEPGGESDLRRRLEASEAETSTVQRERDLLRAENGRLREALERGRGRVRNAVVAGGASLALIAFVAGLAWVGQAGHIGPHPSHPPAFEAGGEGRVALVRVGGAALYAAPERGQPAAQLPGGLKVMVRRLIWNSLFQWAEIAVPGGGAGYVLTTDIDLS